MTDFSHAVFRKLDRIPAAPNFARYNFNDLAKMTKAYVQFAKGMPTVSYKDGMVIIKDLVLGLIDIPQARKAARRCPASPSREAVIGFVDAFCCYAFSRHYQATPSYSDFQASFQIGRELWVPVRPTLIAREHGQLKPIFVFGWKSVPLDTFQRRLLMTILDDAIFSLTDFQDSDAEIVFLPESEGSRRPEVWHRGDYELLSDTEIGNQIELFLTARTDARPIIADWLNSRAAKIQPEDVREDVRQIPLWVENPIDPKV
jgi:hypothetical protein